MLDPTSTTCEGRTKVTGSILYIRSNKISRMFFYGSFIKQSRLLSLIFNRYLTKLKKTVVTNW
jgi:hypothetical protein